MSECWTLGISQFFRVVSVCSWICAQLPQIYTNYVTQSTEGISPTFLLLWFCGDFLSFASCFLSDSILLFQLYLSLFFLLNDVILCYQYYYYGNFRSRILPEYELQISNDFDSESFPEAQSHATQLHRGLSMMHIRTVNVDPKEARIRNESPSPGSAVLDVGEPSMTQAFAGVLVNAALASAMANDVPSFATATTGTSNKELYATLLAWSCTFVYVSSRIPQLVKNRRRQSVEGISPLLFSSALLGNLTYTLSILTSCEFLFSPDGFSFFMHELPYMLGSSGTIVFDMVYFYQRYKYKPSNLLTLEMTSQLWEES